MNDLEFLDHCEQLCDRSSSDRTVLFPSEDAARLRRMAEKFTNVVVGHSPVPVDTRRATLVLIRRGIVSSTMAALRK